jgi:hypothetical protein
VDNPANACTVSLRKQSNGPSNIRLQEIIPMASALVAVPEVCGRVKKHVAPAQMFGKTRDVAHVAFHDLHREARELDFRFFP